MSEESAEEILQQLNELENTIRDRQEMADENGDNMDSLYLAGKLFGVIDAKTIVKEVDDDD